MATGRTILAKRNVRTNQFYTISTYTVVSQLDAVGLFCSNKLSLVIYNTEFRRELKIQHGISITTFVNYNIMLCILT